VQKCIKILGNINYMCEYADMNWGNLEYFLAVARTGSLSSASKILEVNHSTVARRLDKLEDQLNIKLFKRHNRGYQLTEHGLALEKEANKVEEQVNKIHRVFSTQQSELSGTLTISKPMNGGLDLSSMATEFIKKYPNINLNLKSSSKADLSLHQVDISIQITNKPNEDLIGTNLGKIPGYIFGEESYIDKIKDVDDLDWIVWVDDSGVLDMEERLIRLIDSPKIVIRTNSYSEIIDYMNSGAGVSLISGFGLPENHKLKAYRPDKYKFDNNIWLLYHPDLRDNAKVKAFKEFFIKQFNSRMLEKNKLVT
jgi:DNA-binding transcriptional LysR family regulator